MSRKRTAALVGNPNAGKSALFNALTGARQKIANYPGVTVERKAGRLTLPSGEPVELIDLPGSYSFDAASPDEEVTRKVIHGEFDGEQFRERDQGNGIEPTELGPEVGDSTEGMNAEDPSLQLPPTTNL